MRHVAMMLLAVGSLAAVPPRAAAQRAAKDLAAFTLASGTRRQYRSVATGLLNMPSHLSTPSGVGPLEARVSWSTLGVGARPAGRSCAASHTAPARAFT